MSAPPHRILMTADTVGGVWSYALSLSRALASSGVEVVLASMGQRPTAEQRRNAGSIPSVRLVESDYRLEWMDESWDDVERAGEWLLRLEAETRPELVHLNCYTHAALPFHAPKVAVAHSCVLSWWEAVRGGAAPAEWDAYRGALRRGLSAAEAVVAPTASMLASLHRLHGPVRHHRVIPNGIELHRFAPARKEPVVFSAGRLWDEAKNLAVLDEAAADIPWPVMVAGDRQHPNGGSADSRHVWLLGQLGPGLMAHWLGRAAIYAFPARYEPFGLSVLEAAASGCALVLGDIASLREIWDGAALFVDPADPGALAADVRRLIAGPSERAALAAQARRRAASYPIERTAAAYLALYGELVGERAPAERA